MADFPERENCYEWSLQIPKGALHGFTEAELIEQFEAMKLAALRMLVFARLEHAANEARESPVGGPEPAET